MFKFTAEPKFTHDVKICVPVDGGHIDQSLKVTFRVVPVDELGETGTLEGQEKLLRRIVCGLDEMVDEQGKALSYSDDLRDQLIRVPYVRSAMVQSYIQAVTKTKLGN